MSRIQAVYVAAGMEDGRPAPLRNVLHPEIGFAQTGNNAKGTIRAGLARGPNGSLPAQQERDTISNCKAQKSPETALRWLIPSGWNGRQMKEERL
jgi:hypothetical protein